METLEVQGFGNGRLEQPTSTDLPAVPIPCPITILTNDKISVKKS